MFRFLKPLALFLSALGLLRADTPAKTVTPAPDLAVNPAAVVAPLDPKLPTIFVAGDSTAARNNGKPIQGWGLPFADYFDSTKVNVSNRARGGRSSRTFITEGLWDQLLAEVKAGDYVLIQFGHNDSGAVNREPPGSNRPLRARGSLPGLGEETEEIDNAVTGKHEIVHTFGWYIRKMVADVRAKGATPILLTLTLRNIWTDGKIERSSGKYREWMRRLSEDLKTPIVDLSRIAADDFQTRGPDAVGKLFGPDHTHTNSAGADTYASMVVSGLKGLRKSPFEPFLSAKGAAVKTDPIAWLNLPEPLDPKLISIFFIGDSTVRNGRGDGEGGQWGWGDLIAEDFDPAKINVVNRAVGGLSSRTFLNQGNWRRAKLLMKKGDFLLIQFGHNDDAPLNDDKRARGTIKGAGDEVQEIDNILTKQHEVVHTYGWYLRSFVREAKELGVTPIICSPIPRKSWKDGKVSRQNEGYGKWARQVAEEEKVGFLDLNEAIARRYEELGQEKVEPLFADEHTHTSREGAGINAGIVLGLLRSLPGDPVAAYLSDKGKAVPPLKP